jgi:hypothetical protein
MSHDPLEGRAVPFLSKHSAPRPGFGWLEHVEVRFVPVCHAAEELLVKW